MTRSKRTERPEEIPDTEVPADITTPAVTIKTTAVQAITVTEPVIPRTASFRTFADLSSKTVLRKRTKSLTAFRNITAPPNGISSREAYITAEAGLAKLRDVSSGHIRWNPETRNMPPLGREWPISSNMVLPREEIPEHRFTAVPATAAIAAPLLCVWIALAIAFAETGADKNF